MDAGNGQSQHDQDNSKPHYTIPGILHYVQHEWNKFDMERSQFDIERAEFQAKIAFLEGERKGQENLKRDLVRRVKMLEFALRQERARTHKLQFGSEMPADMRSKSNPSVDELKQSEIQSPIPTNKIGSGRQLLRQYLQEVGYSETILDVRSQRVRALLKSNSDANKLIDPNSPAENTDVHLINGPSNGTSTFLTQANKLDGEDFDEDDFELADNAEGLGRHFIGDITENHEGLCAGEITLDSDDDDDDDDDDANSSEYNNDDGNNDEKGGDGDDTSVNNNETTDVDDVTDEIMSQFDFLGNDDLTDSALSFPDGESESPVKDWPVDQNKIEAMKEQFQKEKRSKKKGSKRPVKKDLLNMLETLKGTDTGTGGGAHRNNDDSSSHQVTEEDSLPYTVGGPRRSEESIENALGLGDLAGLTVANEADILCLNVNSTKEPFRKMWNPKYNLRSHFDGVRSVRFLPNVSGVITASEDHTLKLWNLNKPITSKRTSSLDLDPIYSFRGHLGSVLCCEIGNEGETCYSGGFDSTIRSWKVPTITSDPYETYDPSVAGNVLGGHTDAVWSLSYSGSARNQLLSASSDMTVRLWNPDSSDPLLQTYAVNTAGAPTCVEFVKCDTNHAVVSHADGKIAVYDLETGKTPVILQDSGDDEDRVNCVVSHPTMPITISAHDDRQIKFFDNKSGQKIHQMVAHLDVVSSLAVDPNGLYLLSGSHDCSIRLWNLDTKTCIQELTSHRKKFDESIYSVAFHPSATYIASAGADATVKVFE